MPLQPFAFPLPETRLLNADGIIFKFKIRPGNTFRCINFKRDDGFHEELEAIIRTVLGNLNNLTPFFSTHYSVYPYKKPWKSFTQPDVMRKKVYPHVIVLYLEKILENGIRMKPKRRRTDSALEDAIIKDLAEEMEFRSMPSPTCKVHVGDKHGEEVKEGPEHTAEKTPKAADEKEDIGYMGATDEDKAEDENEDEDENTPAKAGFLTRLASYIFPFSLFSREQSGETH